MKMFQCETWLEIHRQSGFSLIKMMIVWAILATGATTAMRVVNNKMEETITARTVSELNIAAETAYECYVASDCAADNPKGGRLVRMLVNSRLNLMALRGLVWVDSD